MTDTINIRQHMNGTTCTCTFSNESLTDDQIEELTLYLPSTCQNLRLSRVDLSETAVNYIAENLLLRGNNSHLKSLSLYCTKLTDEGITSICRAMVDGDNHKLRFLDIQLNNITDIGALEIAKMLEVNKGLEILDMSYMNILHDGFMAVLTALVEKNRTLKILDFTGSTAIDESMKEMIVKIKDRVHIINMCYNYE
ncbi:hypothetical protein I4U23_015221 [Adineta vaga]|nr:hypothetical protein I4U23_015221 [Adineta vaga]